MSPRPRTELCTGCGDVLHDETRRFNRCPECTRSYYREWSKTPKARAKTRRAGDKYRQTEHGKLRRKAANLKCDYGITIADFDLMVKQQNNQCAICQRNFSEADLKPSVDHCHESGIVRGLLCQPCNVGLGWFRDNPDALSRAVEYLLEHKSFAGQVAA